MDNKNFSNTVFFDIDLFSFKEIFVSASPWDTVSQITQFIEKLFVSGKITGNYKDRKDVFVGEGTIIHPSVDIAGPAIIGKNCKISHAAFLREACIIGDNVHLGHAVEVKHSIILNNTVIAHLNYIGDSIIGNNVNISGGAILANFRLDKQNISIKTNNGKIDTGLQKFSAAIGDNSVIGVNSVINPGTLLGKNTVVFPLKSVSGVHENNAVIK
jgi:NDP-sugar pyrophosphorylase family protein